jgi:hypothetical protein
MKHFGIITVVLALLMVSSLFASERNTLKISARALDENGEKVIIPLQLKNVREMAALDLPLQFSEGVVLEEVTFDGTRSEDFDFKWANINNDQNTVVIGLIPMMFGEKPDLAPGDGLIANLIFRREDPKVKEIQLTPITLTNPDHEPMFIYTDENGEVQSEKPDMVGFASALDVDVEGETGEEAEAVLPKEFALKQNAPNPFNPSTSISYDLPKACNVQLDIYNVLGQKVKTLVSGYQEAGSQTIFWDGSNSSGSPVASGVYFYRISAGEFNATKKMMMLK